NSDISGSVDPGSINPGSVVANPVNPGSSATNCSKPERQGVETRNSGPSGAGRRFGRSQALFGYDLSSLAVKRPLRRVGKFGNNEGSDPSLVVQSYGRKAGAARAPAIRTHCAAHQRRPLVLRRQWTRRLLLRTGNEFAP